jgi:hypothetical protein
VCVALKGKQGRQLHTLVAQDDGKFRLDMSQAVAGMAFFKDPGSAAPAMMIGVHALRKAERDSARAWECAIGAFNDLLPLFPPIGQAD